MNSGDPQGKRALFEAVVPGSVEPQHSGRQALFSTVDPKPGTVVVECSSCDEHRRIQTGEAIARILRFTLWVPFIRHNRWMQCPSCEKRAWCHVGWLD